MRKPNTFIVGAPKCGTTAMAAYLSDHENVFMSTPKEPNHFLYEDMPKKSNYPSLEQYLSIFSEATENHTVIAEASVWYLYSADAIKKISAFDSSAKIIAMLRRPDEMVYSMHSQALATMQENIADFDQAWELSVSANKRTSYSKLCKEPRLLQYNEIAKYGEQLTNVVKHFPNNQVHIVFYEDFKSNTSLEYEKALQFLNLPQDGRQHFPTVNPNTQIRNEKAGAFLKKPPPGFMRVVNIVKKILGIEKLGIKDKLTNLNQKNTQRNALEGDIRIKIIKNYKYDIAILSTLTNKDLTHWLNL